MNGEAAGVGASPSAGQRRVASRRPTPGAPPSDTVLRLAVLLQAGVPPARAWEHLADTGDVAAARVASALARGAPLPLAVSAAVPPSLPRRPRGKAADPDAEWPDVAAAWQVATTVGAPLADSLRGLATALRDGREAGDDVRVALAEPAATARLMAGLPLVAIALGAAFGFDTMTTLFANPIGVACVVAGVVLILVSRLWTRRLIASARPTPGIPGIGAELLAVALSGGVSIDRARQVVGEATQRSPDPETDDVLALSRSAGVPAVELLRASAALARHRARIDGRLRAARLATRLLLPLGVCTLPAFLLLGVAPMLLSVMTSVPLEL